MKVYPIRIKNYMSEIRRNSLSLQELLDQNEIVPPQGRQIHPD